MTELVRNDLNRLAKEINDAHIQVNESFKYTLKHAIYAGEKLIRAKNKCGHGNWLRWREEKIAHGTRTSQVYMNLAINKQLILTNTQKTAHLTIDAALRLIKGGIPMLQSMSNEWYTPAKYIEAVREVLGAIELDPASSHKANETVKAEVYFTEDDDGLSREWYGKVFLNPPYGRLTSEFAGCLYEQLGSTVTEAIMLVNSRATDADWFQPCFEGAICFTDHRIDFNSPDEKLTSSTHGSCFVYFGDNERKFADVFSKFGNIVQRFSQPSSPARRIRQATVGLDTTKQLLR